MLGREIKYYGYRPDIMDQRDKLYGDVHRAAAAAAPASVNLTSKLDLTFDQGELGSCTANSVCWMWQFVHGAADDHGSAYSRMFVYVESLIAEGSYPQDAGAEIRDVIKVMNKLGVPAEKDDPYVVSKFPHKPSATAVKDAAKDKVPTYSSLISRVDFMNCLAAGFPFVIGFSVYESFESDAVASTGVVPMPKKTEQLLGGHAVCVVGYDKNFAGRKNNLYYLVKNSWGADWGDPKNPGCFWMPAAYFEDTDLADDAWTVRAA